MYKMRTKPIALALAVMFFAGCSKDETPNTPPSAFNLSSVPNNSSGIDRQPQFSWESAADAEQGNVTYDLYLDANSDPTTMVISNLDDTEFTLPNRLNLLTDYYWKVVAKDGKGGVTQSSTFKFTTRDLRLTESIDNVGYTGSFETQAVLFKSEFWMAINNEIWHSEMGVIWQKVHTFPFDYSGYAFAAYNGKLWLIGGSIDQRRTNAVWSSEDGSLWTQTLPVTGFPIRSNHSAVSFDGKLWVFGGVTSEGLTFGDAWHTTDGVSWTEVPIQSGYGNRTQQATIVFDDKIWISGGVAGTLGLGAFPTSSIYCSSDGMTWEAVENSPVNNAFGHTLAVYEDKLWILGGRDQEGNYLNTIWNSANGLEWQQTPNTDQSIFQTRSGLAALSFKGRLYIFGGHRSAQLFTDVRIAD